MAVTTLDPKTALVVIDLQNGIAGNPGLAPHPAAEVVERAARLADAFREQSLP
ncbi:isochorismatase family protein, partial [Streptomyces sp. NPDC127044]